MNVGESEPDEKNDKAKNEIIQFLNKIKYVNIFDEKNDKELLNAMINIRYKVTEFQREMWERRAERRKKISRLIE